MRYCTTRTACTGTVGYRKISSMIRHGALPHGASYDICAGTILSICYVVFARELLSAICTGYFLTFVLCRVLPNMSQPLLVVPEPN